MFEGWVAPGHLMIVLLVAVFVFGPRRIPELGRSLGSGIRGFKHALDGHDDREANAVDPSHRDAPDREEDDRECDERPPTQLGGRL
jgi:sec-independent protein translocase protein TatA